MYIPLEDGGAVSAADVVCDLSSEGLVVHQEDIEFPDVVDEELLETVREEVAGLKEERLILGEDSFAIPSSPFCCYRNQSKETSQTKSEVQKLKLRTLGIAVWPLKRRLTLLSIPLGFLHASFTPW